MKFIKDFFTKKPESVACSSCKTEKTEDQGNTSPTHSNSNQSEPTVNSPNSTTNNQPEEINTPSESDAQLSEETPETEPVTEETTVQESDEELPKTEEPIPIVSEKLEKDDVMSEMYVLLRQLAKDFEVKLKYDSTKQAQIDKLYNENQSFKEGLIKKFQHSLILAVIEQIDEAAKQIIHFGNAAFSEENYRKLLNSYQEVADDFRDVLLEKFDVVNYRSEPDSQFDPKRQRSLKTCPVNDQSKHKLIKQSLRPGYAAEDGFVLRPEMVEVYVFDSQQSVT
ncbi:MAG: hypothetical protein LBF88_14000 [Planctomycetaceae bacterium]|jgi:molecular chaperone GrpE (heat shock protein)|nr:hypothetical protein [Planctomycetaceae bacterium]